MILSMLGQEKTNKKKLDLVLRTLVNNPVVQNKLGDKKTLIYHQVCEKYFYLAKGKIISEINQGGGFMGEESLVVNHYTLEKRPRAPNGYEDFFQDETIFARQDNDEKFLASESLYSANPEEILRTSLTNLGFL